jgi:hypothetical protein
MQTAERKAMVSSPELESLTTSHIERVFLTVRQELKRFQRKGLGYSNDLSTHTAAVSMFLILTHDQKYRFSVDLSRLKHSRILNSSLVWKFGGCKAGQVSGEPTAPC